MIKINMQFIFLTLIQMNCNDEIFHWEKIRKEGENMNHAFKDIILMRQLKKKKRILTKIVWWGFFYFWPQYCSVCEILANKKARISSL